MVRLSQWFLGTAISIIVLGFTLGIILGSPEGNGLFMLGMAGIMSIYAFCAMPISAAVNIPQIFSQKESDALFQKRYNQGWTNVTCGFATGVTILAVESYLGIFRSIYRSIF